MATNIVRVDGLPVAPATARAFANLKAAFEKAFPGIYLRVNSGYRSYEDQVKIFLQRYVTFENINGRRVYDERRWNGTLYYRISPVGTVAQPGTSNHSDGRSIDIYDTGADPGVTKRGTVRDKWMEAHAKDYGFDNEGYNFSEAWHKTLKAGIDPWDGGSIPAGVDPSDQGITNGSGGTAPTNDLSEEDEDMRLFRIQDESSARNGSHYAVAPGFIAEINKDTVKMLQDAGYRAEVAVKKASFEAVLRGNGIPAAVLDSKGDVENAREGKAAHPNLGYWHASDKAERFSYLAQK